MYLLTIGSAIGLAPYILRSYGLASNLPPVRREWRRNAWPIMAAGLLFFVAYGLVLAEPVSYVAPVRR